uniref:Nucleotidyltransferase n=1 Tax=Ignavibacterium album TaxID=591197 RepID=A0A832G6Z2_9BACT
MNIFKKEILSENQQKLLPIIRKFKRKFFLVGGTAIALYLGHRRSVDFDLFTTTPFEKKSIEARLKNAGVKFKTAYQTKQEWSIFVFDTKITFYYFTEKIQPVNIFENIIRIPSLLDLAVMKAYTIGERSKWKDYVDLYFILRDYLPMQKIIKRATYIFKDSFNEKLFREQLVYFDDIDFSEEINFLNITPSIDEIKQFLTEAAIK